MTGWNLLAPALVVALSAYTCYVLAKDRGLDTRVWIIAGLVFNVFAVAYLVRADQPPIMTLD